ncbi:MAG: ABC transporter ATP-binding protein [Oscillospiraceae bacterium]|nr:ABC transporter ATP-binding protein [Oscillospiraceae bacterium]
MLIQAIDIKRGFPMGGGTFWALNGISLNVAESKLTILKGRSGSGKTTMMNLLGALDYPTEGEVIFNGLPISSASERLRGNLRRREIGFVFQSVALIGMMTAFENVEFALRISGYPERGRKKRVEACMDLVGLSSRMYHMPAELSGGEQQRVAIARAIVHEPKVIFADEPTAELDTNTGLQVVKIFKDLIDSEGTTVVMTTHDPDLMDVADRVYELADGRIINEY